MKININNSKIIKRNFAFTLAEVLVSLGIIGVVAAITLPVLIQNYQKQATATSLKKAYSELNQVLQRSMVDNGDIKTWNNSFEFGVDNWAKTYIEPYIKVEKSGSCTNQNGPRCLGISYMGNLGSKPTWGNNRAHYMIVKSGGSRAWAFYRYYPYKEIRVYVYLQNPKKYSQAAIRGKDVFTFVLYPDKDTTFNPFGMQGTIPFQGGTITRDILLHGPIRTGGCYKESGGPDYYGPGDSCGAVIMMDDWKISKDYPW